MPDRGLGKNSVDLRGIASPASCDRDDAVQRSRLEEQRDAVVAFGQPQRRHRVVLGLDLSRGI